MELIVLEQPQGEIIALGMTLGDLIGEFFVAADSQVYFRPVGAGDIVWAGPGLDSFRRIAAAWTRYRAEVRALQSDSEQVVLVGRMRRELAQLGALPNDLPRDPEPLWSFLLFEAEHGLG